MRAWKIRGGELKLGGAAVLMGILNVTPDSFSDGGDFTDPAKALEQASRMAKEGAAIIDIGGESTRPGAMAVDAENEMRRVLPVLEHLSKSTGPSPLPFLSIDTYKAATARRALESGAQIVNDVWGLQRDAEMAHVVADFGAGVVVMHNREAADEALPIMDEIKSFLSRSVDIARKAGIADDNIVIDPGIGFGKTMLQNVEILSRLGELKELGLPILVGASRKRFIGYLTGIEDPKDRLEGTLGAHLAAIANGADILRVHDVAAHRAVLGTFTHILRHQP
jgi:dihydropteroate synthase